MNDLLQMYGYLNQAMQDDALLCLAQTVCWLDPLWRGHDEDFYQDPDGILSAALVVTRQSFPDVYVDAVDKLRQGASYEALDKLICKGISATGIPLDHLEYLLYGIPLPAYGVELNDADFYSTHPEVIPILACFGISPEPNPYHMTIPDCIYIAGRYIATDLENHPDERYRQISWLMQWLWSSSGNSSIDLSYDEICEFQPLSWEKDEFEFAVAIIEEANGIMSDVLEGLDFLSNSPDLLTALQHNVNRIYKAIKKLSPRRYKLKVRLSWPSTVN